MKRKRRQFSSDFKATVALEAIQNESTTAELCNRYDITSAQISKWKSELMKNASQLFNDKPSSVPAAVIDSEKAPLYEEIGRLKIELDFLKKKSIQMDQMRRSK